MRYIKLTGICLAVILGVCAMAVTASAAEDIYKIEGSELEEGEIREITASAKTEFTLKAKGALNVEAVVRCKGLALEGTEDPEIIGGTPGTSANEVIKFEGCTATVGGVKCSWVEIENAKLNGELVTIRVPSGLSGKLATLFTPASGKTLLEVKLKSCGILGNETAMVEGTTAAAVSSEGAIEPTEELAWKEKEEITEIEKHNGTKGVVGLTSDKKLATLNGEALVKAPAPKIGIVEPTKEPLELKNKTIGDVVYENEENVVGGEFWHPGGAKFVKNDRGFSIFNNSNTCSGNLILPQKRCKIEVAFVGEIGEEDELKIKPAPNVDLKSIP